MNVFKQGGARTFGAVAVVTGLSAFVAVNTFQGPLEKAATDHKSTGQAMVEEQNPEQAKTTNPSDQARNTTAKPSPPSEEEKQRSMQRMNRTRSASRHDLSAWLPWNGGGGKA